MNVPEIVALSAIAPGCPARPPSRRSGSIQSAGNFEPCASTWAIWDAAGRNGVVANISPAIIAEDQKNVTIQHLRIVGPDERLNKLNELIELDEKNLEWWREFEKNFAPPIMR